jgi:GGDEF domain-containing protein
MSSDVRQRIESYADMRRTLVNDHKAGKITQEVFRDYDERLRALGEQYRNLQEELRMTKLTAKQRENLLREIAKLDRMTGLYNKDEFEKRILPTFVRDMARDRRELDERRSELAALWYMDLNNFKLINDTEDLGHDIGDDVIKVWSDMLKKQIRHIVPHMRPDASSMTASDRPWDEHIPSGIPARVGGDEFVVLQTNIKKYSEALLAADRIAMLYRTYPWESVHPLLPAFNLTVSIGVVVLRLHDFRVNPEVARIAVKTAPKIAAKWQKRAGQEMYFVKRNHLDHVKIVEVGYLKGKLIDKELVGGLSLEMNEISPSA